jgi:probable F420-dependent oxidoreductase
VTDRPFRFGATATRAESGDEWKKLCRRVERAGCSTLHLSDHFNEQFSPLPALAAAAAVTTTLRIGPLVLCNDFRRPVALAKELATVDRLSDGRLEWGMGAGWHEPEYDAAGVAFDPPAVRVDRLVEAIEVMKPLLAGESSTHDGTHYRTGGVTGWPPAVQRPHPPLLVGAAGRRLLSYAAREADIVGVGPSVAAHPAMGAGRRSYVEATDEQLRWITDAARGRAEGPELHMVAFPVVVTDEPDEVWRNVARSAGVSVDEMRTSPHVLIGSVDQICGALEVRRERWGVSYWSLPEAILDRVAPIVERLTGR